MTETKKPITKVFEHFTIEHTDNYALIKISAGKLNGDVSPPLKVELRILNANNVKNFIIDLSKVTFTRSSGLSALLVSNKLCASLSGNSIVIGVCEPVKKLIEYAQCEKILTIVSTMDDALAIINKTVATAK